MSNGSEFPGPLWFKQCFALAKNAVPFDLRELAETLCTQFLLTEKSAPLHIANVAAWAMCRGDGRGLFFSPSATNKSEPGHLAAKRVTCRLAPLLFSAPVIPRYAHALRLVTQHLEFRALQPCINGTGINTNGEGFQPL
jgi:hypothetical protein